MREYKAQITVIIILAAVSPHHNISICLCY